MSATSDGTDSWAQVVRACQSVVNTAAALQDEAIVRLAAIEPFVTDDGEVHETHKAPGHIALDAPAIVSGALETTAVHAERRVRAAVRLAADGPAGTSTSTGLGALHDAMRAGDLDHYRAGVVSTELEEAPDEVAEAVIASLGDHLTSETGPQLRSRCRRLLARISPDLLRQRAVRARSECSLRRWVAEPGVDQWEATFPSEDAARAWSAIDERARQLVADGTHERLDRARAQALIDLVMNSATITTVITLTVPAPDPTVPGPPRTDGTGPEVTDRRGPEPQPLREAGLVEVATGRGLEKALVPAVWVAEQVRASAIADPTTIATTAKASNASPGAADQRGQVRVETRGCHPVTGALLDHRESAAYRPPEGMAALVRQRDGTCRFPGCTVAARFCDLDHARPWPLGPTSPANLMGLCRRHHRVKQRPGWAVRLDPDGTATWTDPTGRVRTTLPVDALHTVTLPGPTQAPRPASSDAPPVDHDGDTTRGCLELALEHLGGTSLPTGVLQRMRRKLRRPADLRHGLPTVSTPVTVLDPGRACRASRHRDRRLPDAPPF